MKKIYPLIMVLALMAFTKGVLGQAILLDDNHSLTGFPIFGKIVLNSERDSTFWSSNGTAAGTMQFSPVKSEDRGFGFFNNKIYFAGLNAANGSELWSTDGTGGGTVLVNDIWTGPDSSKPQDFVVFNNNLFFTAYTPALGREMYQYTGSGTATAITDLNPASGNSFDTPLEYLLNGYFYFDASNATGTAVYAMQSTGTITKILDLPAGYQLNSYEHLGNTLFFAISNGINGMSIYKTTGAAAASLVKSFTGPFSGFIPPQMIHWNNKIFFTATETGFDNELWVTDGTTTNQVADINPGPNGSTPIIANSVELNNKLVFMASTDASGAELWTTDGTSGGTSMLIDLNTNPGDGSTPVLWPVFINFVDFTTTPPDNFDVYNRTANYNGYIFFTADNGTDGVELYKTNGTAIGTVPVKNLNPSGDGAGSSYIYTESGVVFEGDDGSNGTEPWMSDGTGPGTTPIVNINLSGNSDPTFFYIWNGDIYLNADNGNGGPEGYFDFYKLQGPYSPLPVTLNGFKATVTDNNVLLNWNTSSENNSDQFSVLRSIDGEHFEGIGNVVAAGQSTTTKNYSFIDNDAYNQGVTKLYYRLNMQDKDGRSYLSKIVVATLNDLPVTLSLYPNPVHGVLKIKYNAPQGGLVNISDLNGKVLYKATVAGSALGLHQVNIGSYPSGTYVLKFIHNEKTTIQKFIKE